MNSIDLNTELLKKLQDKQRPKPSLQHVLSKIKSLFLENPSDKDGYLCDSDGEMLETEHFFTQEDADRIKLNFERHFEWYRYQDTFGSISVHLVKTKKETVVRALRIRLDDKFKE